MLRRKLIPTFEFGCRRMLLSSEFYPALTQPNVDVVQSGVIRFTDNGVVDKDRVEWPVDVVILATGFHTQRHEAKDMRIRLSRISTLAAYCVCNHADCCYAWWACSAATYSCARCTKTTPSVSFEVMW